MTLSKCNIAAVMNEHFCQFKVDFRSGRLGYDQYGVFRAILDKTLEDIKEKYKVNADAGTLLKNDKTSISNEVVIDKQTYIITVSSDQIDSIKKIDGCNTP